MAVARRDQGEAVAVARGRGGGDRVRDGGDGRERGARVEGRRGGDGEGEGARGGERAGHGAVPPHAQGLHEGRHRAVHGAVLAADARGAARLAGVGADSVPAHAVRRARQGGSAQAARPQRLERVVRVRDAVLGLHQPVRPRLAVRLRLPEDDLRERQLDRGRRVPGRVLRRHGPRGVLRGVRPLADDLDLEDGRRELGLVVRRRPRAVHRIPPGPRVRRRHRRRHPAPGLLLDRLLPPHLRLDPLRRGRPAPRHLRLVRQRRGPADRLVLHGVRQHRLHEARRLGHDHPLRRGGPGRLGPRGLRHFLPPRLPRRLALRHRRRRHRLRRRVDHRRREGLGGRRLRLLRRVRHRLLADHRGRRLPRLRRHRPPQLLALQRRRPRLPRRLRPRRRGQPLPHLLQGRHLRRRRRHLRREPRLRRHPRPDQRQAPRRRQVLPRLRQPRALRRRRGGRRLQRRHPRHHQRRLHLGIPRHLGLGRRHRLRHHQVHRARRLPRHLLALPLLSADYLARDARR
mmetsp:Transcript_10107/g.32517  ORF Transcript_10107/g.32517 Transcript_10107/m.32517 type:complete len:515 (-) Transcript_10107:310-1854(-)